MIMASKTAVPNGDVFRRGYGSPFHQLPAQRRINHGDGADPEVAADLVVINGRPHFFPINISPQSRVPHQGKQKAGLLPDRIGVGNEPAQQPKRFGSPVATLPSEIRYMSSNHRVAYTKFL